MLVDLLLYFGWTLPPKRVPSTNRYEKFVCERHWCRCENVKVKFQQRDIERDMWETVEPGDSIDYAWEEPNMAHRLCVVMQADSVRDNSEHEYNLDVIKVHPQHVIDSASLYNHIKCTLDTECWSDSPCCVLRSWYTMEEHSKTTPKTFKLELILQYSLCKTHNAWRLDKWFQLASRIRYPELSLHESWKLYSLQAFPVVKLRRTNIKIVHKVANTVGRVMTTGINMTNKSHVNVASQDQPDVDARYVYVGVHADGPTRVLCFSETRDEYTRGTNEESVTLLTQKLKSLEERDQVGIAIANFKCSIGVFHLRIFSCHESNWTEALSTMSHKQSKAAIEVRSHNEFIYEANSPAGVSWSSKLANFTDEQRKYFTVRKVELQVNERESCTKVESWFKLREQDRNSIAMNFSSNCCHWREIIRISFNLVSDLIIFILSLASIKALGISGLFMHCRRWIHSWGQ